MRKRELKKQLRDAFSKETPNILSEIETSCANESQIDAPLMMEIPETEPERSFFTGQGFRKAVACALCLMLFMTGLFVGFLIPDGNRAVTAETFVYLDVNPSIELQLDEENRVVACIAGNEDAKTVLAQLNLIGTEMNTAIASVVGSMYVNGYLSAEKNSILVSVDNRNEAKTEALLTDIADKINIVFGHSGLDCSIIAQSVRSDPDLKQRAAEFGISVGKMHLIEKMIDGLESLSEENVSDLSKMSIGGLNFMYSAGLDGTQNDIFQKDVVSGAVGGFLKTDEALSSLLDAIHLRSDLLDTYETYAQYAEIDHEWHIVYCISIVLKGDLASYHFKVDCRTGEVLEFDLNINIPDFGFR